MSEPLANLFDLDAPSAETPSGDFADAMQQLADEAQGNGGNRPAGPAVSKAARAEFLLAIGQMIRPLAVGVEELGERLAKLSGAPSAATTPDFAPLHATLESVRGHLGRLGNVESANQKLFDALHTELKGYKDGFLFDALQKPFVRDLLVLHDDLAAIGSQIEARRPQAAGRGTEVEFLTTLTQNFDNARYSLLETLERLDVEGLETVPGEPVDKRVHRVAGFESAPTADRDGRVARSLRPGFAWRGCPVRPEEVVAWRWTEPNSSAPAAAPAPESSI